MDKLSLNKDVASQQLLSQSMAASLLDQMRTTWAEQHGAILHPTWIDFNKLLTDNDRRQWVKGRERCGKPKGNRHLYGVIECKKIGNKCFYSVETLEHWFNNQYVPKMLKKAA